jgi:hypothetical protein
MTDATNVVIFAPRPKEVPALTFVEIRLVEEDCSLVVTVHDAAGNAFAIDYALGWSPPGFDLDRLREAWSRWRGSTAAAS